MQIGAGCIKQVTWCRAVVQRSGAGLHLSDKVVLPTKRFVYPVSFHPERKRDARVKKLEVIEMKKKFF